MFYKNVMVVLVAAVLTSIASFTQAASIGNFTEQSAKCYETSCYIPANKLRFLMIGDFGGRDAAPFTTDLQRSVASAIANFTKNASLKPAFVINVGDNFYPIGVKSAFDPRFNDTFEAVYSDRVLWYSIAGNHDWYGSINAQVNYTAQSDKWVMPNLYYAFEYILADGTRAKFVAIDTQVMCGKTRHSKDPKLAIEVPQGTDAENLQLAAQQEEWLAGELRNTTGIHHLFIIGHYQVYAIGTRIQIPCMKQKLGASVLGKHRVSAYIGGHVHQLQHIRMTSSPENSSKQAAIHYIISGEASRTDEPEHFEDGIPSESKLFEHGGPNRTAGGFVAATITAASVEFQFYDAIGVLLYSATIPARSQSREDTSRIRTEIADKAGSKAAVSHRVKPALFVCALLLQACFCCISKSKLWYC